MDLAYDLNGTWEENCERGPQFADNAAAVAGVAADSSLSQKKNFLGLPVRSRIGIAAGLLLNSRWILPYAQRGFDILTYKTVRSSARPCYPLPNWVFVEETDPPGESVIVMDRPSDDPAQVSSSVCFGMPSASPEVWRPDVARCRAGLADGQLLIVSVVATPNESPSLSAIAADFAQCAAWAVESGAQIVEANLSCPNVCSAEGTLYLDTEASRTIAGAIRAAIGDAPLLVKVGTFPDADRQRQFLNALNGVINGITLVNCVSRPVLKQNGQPAFGPKFRTAGVLGRAIHEPSVAAVRTAAECIQRDRLLLEVAAVGGASTADDFADFFAAGASAVLCGSAPMYLPNLARDIHRSHPDW